MYTRRELTTGANDTQDGNIEITKLKQNQKVNKMFQPHKCLQSRSHKIKTDKPFAKPRSRTRKKKRPSVAASL